jgi:hypothetical protein
LADHLHQQNSQAGRQAAEQESLQGITTAGSLNSAGHITNAEERSMTTAWPTPNCQLLLHNYESTNHKHKVTLCNHQKSSIFYILFKYKRIVLSLRD